MLTLLLALSPSADAAESYKMDAPPDFKTCVTSTDDTWSWWYGVESNLSYRAGPTDRSYGTCFDIDGVTSHWFGQGWLEGLAKDYAKLNDAAFSRPTSTEEQIVLSSETSDVYSYPVDWVPVGSGLIDIYEGGLFVGTAETMGVPVEHITITDVDNNGINDILLVMANDEAWHAFNVPWGDYIMHTGQTIFYNY